MQICDVDALGSGTVSGDSTVVDTQLPFAPWQLRDLAAIANPCTYYHCHHILVFLTCESAPTGETSTNIATQDTSTGGLCTSSGLELRMDLPNTSRNPFAGVFGRSRMNMYLVPNSPYIADPSSKSTADWEGDEGEGIVLVITPNQSPQEYSPSA